MSLSITADPVPIAIDAHGVARVGGTRVTLDSVIIAFQLGATVEQIARSYDTLSLADIHATIAYYLRHTAEVDDYLAAAKRRKAEIREFDDAQLDDRQGLRERLLSRVAPQPQ